MFRLHKHQHIDNGRSRGIVSKRHRRRHSGSYTRNLHISTRHPSQARPNGTRSRQNRQRHIARFSPITLIVAPRHRRRIKRSRRRHHTLNSLLVRPTRRARRQGNSRTATGPRRAARNTRHNTGGRVRRGLGRDWFLSSNLTSCTISTDKRARDGTR